VRKEKAMSSQERPRKSGLVVGVLGFVLIFCGCSEQRVRNPVKTNNLHNVSCQKYQPNYLGRTRIEVNATDGISKEDEVVFVCAGENVRWEAAKGSGIKSIEVRFLNNEWPFKQAFEPKLYGQGEGATPDREVGDLPVNFRAKPFKYQIHIVTSTGVIDLDPHIVHGGGGP
jgi:hypothetical protein